MSELKDQITDNAGQPQSVTISGDSARQHSLREQIDADKYLTAQTAKRSGKKPFQIAKILPGGAR